MSDEGQEQSSFLVPRVGDRTPYGLAHSGPACFATPARGRRMHHHLGLLGLTGEVAEQLGHRAERLHQRPHHDDVGQRVAAPAPRRPPGTSARGPRRAPVAAGIARARRPTSRDTAARRPCPATCAPASPPLGTWKTESSRNRSCLASDWVQRAWLEESMPGKSVPYRSTLSMPSWNTWLARNWTRASGCARRRSAAQSPAESARTTARATSSGGMGDCCGSADRGTSASGIATTSVAVSGCTRTR